MKVIGCDECKAIIDTSYGGEDNAIDNGQVMRVEMKVIIEDGLSDSNSPLMNRKYLFCSAKCALKYLNECKKVEDEWLERWKKGGILGKKQFIKRST